MPTTARRVRKVRQLELKQIELLDKILHCFDVLFLKDLAVGVMGVISRNLAEELEERLRHRRKREGFEIPEQARIIDEFDTFGEEFLGKFKSLLNEFVNQNGFGIEYDKRRAARFAGIVGCLKVLAKE